MSVIEQALRKIEDDRRKLLPASGAGEFLAPPVAAVKTNSLWTRSLWMLLGGVAVAALYTVWTQRQTPGAHQAEAVVQGTAPVAAPAPAPNASSPPVALTSPSPVTVPAPELAVTLPAPVVVAAAAAALPVADKSPAPELAWTTPAWLRKGASSLSQGDKPAALKSWSLGLSQLAPEQPVIVLPHSPTDAAALALYRSLASQYPALLVQDPGVTSNTLQVLLVPDAGDLPEMLAELRTQLKRKSLKATTLTAWHATLTAKSASNTALAAAADLPESTAKKPAVIPVRPAMELMESDPTRSVQGTANSSAEAILRRFTEVERMVVSGQFEAAMVAVAQVETEVGETWQTRYLKGTASQGLKRWDDAVQALTRAHQLNPGSMKVLLNRAVCLQELGNHDAALEDLRLARVLSPGTPELVVNAAYSLDALGRRDEALAQYRSFLEMTAGRDEYVKLRTWVAKRMTK